jgi:hypothetical protein
MDLHPCQKTVDVRDETGQKDKSSFMQAMSKAVHGDSVEPRIAKEHFCQAFRRWVSFKNHLYIFF